MTEEKENNEGLPNKEDQQVVRTVIYDAITNNIEAKFKDFQETKTFTMVGLGVQKIHNYICPMPFDQLDKLREEFWFSRNNEDSTWSILKLCCETDPYSAGKLLKIINQVCVQGNLRNTYSVSRPNYVYRIPNFCVIDPIFEKNFDDYYKLYNVTEDEHMIINVQIIGENYSRIDVKARAKYSGLDFKTKLCKALNIDINKQKIILIYKGQEIKDTHCLYYHGLENGSKIIASINERPEGEQPASEEAKENHNIEESIEKK